MGAQRTRVQQVTLEPMVCCTKWKADVILHGERGAGDTASGAAAAAAGDTICDLDAAALTIIC